MSDPGTDKYIGTLLEDRYQILEKIGEGGMAVVYRAKCRMLNRFVAIKVLKDEFKVDEEGVCNLMERISRYTKHIDEHLVKMEDLRKSIEKSTGIQLKGWG